MLANHQAWLWENSVLQWGGGRNQGDAELLPLSWGRAEAPGFHSLSLSANLLLLLCGVACKIIPPPCLCISIITVHVSLGIWLIAKLVLAEEVEDNMWVFSLNKHILQFILLDFVLWMRTPQVILLPSRNCLLTPDYRLQCVPVALEST